MATNARLSLGDPVSAARKRAKAWSAVASTADWFPVFIKPLPGLPSAFISATYVRTGAQSGVLPCGLADSNRRDSRIGRRSRDSGEGDGVLAPRCRWREQYPTERKCFSVHIN